MKIGIVGAGKVGCSLGKYLVEHGVSVTGYSSKTKESVDTAATFTNTRAFASLEELITESDLIFITTPDDIIAKVWNQIAQFSIQRKIICHFSGSLSSVVFSKREEKGVYACSLHPMYAFSDKFTSYKKLNQVMFTAEGDEEALAVVCPLFEKMGHTVCVIPSEKKARYHAAASMVSNMMIGLYEMSVNMLLDCGLEGDDARQLVKPLVEGNIEKLLTTSPEQALTGPIERGDTSTIEKHLSVLKEEEREVYVNLGRMLTDIAKRKNPHRDYTAIEAILCRSVKNSRMYSGEGSSSDAFATNASEWRKK